MRAYQGAKGDDYELPEYKARYTVKQVPHKFNCGVTQVMDAAIFPKTLLTSKGSNSNKVFIVSKNNKHIAVTDVATLGMAVIKFGAFSRDRPSRLGAYETGDRPNNFGPPNPGVHERRNLGRPETSYFECRRYAVVPSVGSILVGYFKAEAVTQVVTQSSHTEGYCFSKREPWVRD